MRARWFPKPGNRRQGIGKHLSRHRDHRRRALHDRRHHGDGRARARGGRRADSGFRPRKPDALVRRGVGTAKRPRLMGRWRQTYRTRAVPAASGMFRKSRAFLPRYQKFESISLHRRVCELLVRKRRDPICCLSEPLEPPAQARRGTNLRPLRSSRRARSRSRDQEWEPGRRGAG
jgi:hypothetical protein